ncbi:MAG: hypothetical protein LBM70_03900 [Victivallales bacterium]|jgi:mRNA-degrading endonuclease RelE of RelBE toxin-antitoxin system|nr:hypothetical protein [Victivallales bacterium]
MKYEINWQKKATKQLLKLQISTQKRITVAVQKLADSAAWTNVRPMVNYQYSHRLRVGDFRVLFDANTTPGEPGEIRILDVQEVRKRDDQTY